MVFCSFFSAKEQKNEERQRKLCYVEYRVEQWQQLLYANNGKATQCVHVYTEQYNDILIFIWTGWR